MPSRTFSPEDPPLWRTWLPLAGLLLLAVLLARPLWDMDLWWHLASGRQFWLTRALLAADPFAYPEISVPSASRLFLLNAYWLAQTLFYLTTKIFGEGGVILLRVGLLLAGPVCLWLWQRRAGVGVAPALATLLLSGWLGHYFTGERPVLFSFWLFALLLILLHQTGFARSLAANAGYRWRTACWLVPLMLVWANLHPGFMLGSLVLVGYLAGELLTGVRYGRPRGFGLVALAIGCALLVTLINPNGLASYLALIKFEGSELQGRTSEYVSPLLMLGSLRTLVWPYWLLLLVALGLALQGRRLLGLTRWGLLLLLAAISLQAYRYLPFFAGAAGVLLLPVLVDLAGRTAWQRSCRIACLGLLAVLAGLVVAHRDDGWGRSLQSVVLPASVPRAAVDFIAAERPAGRLFAHFNWGGYQSWRLAPDYPVMLDGRSLNLAVFDEYTHLLWTDAAMAPLWQKYAIDTMLVPRLKPLDGELYRLTLRLAQDPQWSLVYRDEVAMVLVRGAANRALAARYALPKQRIWEDVLGEAEANLRAGRSPLFAYQAIYQAYRQLGRMSEATEAARQLQRLKQGQPPASKERA